MTGHVDAGRLKCGAHALGDAGCDIAFSGDHRGKLLAAKPADDVVDAHVGARDPGEQPQRIVAGRVAETIVDVLEVIEVEHQQRHRLPIARA